MNNFIINTFDNPLQTAVILETQENVLQDDQIIIDDNTEQNVSVFTDEKNNIYFFLKDFVEETKNFSDDKIFLEENFLIGNEKPDEEYVEKIESPQIEFEQEKKLDESNYEVDINSIADVVEAFKCKKCNFLTQDKTSLVLHFKDLHSDENAPSVPQTVPSTEEQQILYVCSKCSISLPSIKACHEHMIEDHHFKIASLEKNVCHKNDAVILKSEECPKITKQPPKKSTVDKYWSVPRTYKEVKMRLQGDRTFKCTNKLCLYKFETLDSMLAHKSCHVNNIQNEKPTYKKDVPKNMISSFACTVCQKNFMSWPKCSLHLWRAHSMSLDLLVCPLCKTLRTHSASKMSQHLAHHWRKNQNENNCVSCKTETDTENPPDLPKWYAKMKCELCSKMFSNSKSLKKHIQVVHKKIKPFTCNVCGHSSSTKHTMQLHIRQHTGEKPYACDLCNYRTGDHNTLRKHRMRHTGERPYKCSYCTYASKQSAPLKHHLKTAHPDKPVPNCLHQGPKDEIK